VVTDGSSGSEQCQCRAAVINNGEGGQVGEDRGESSEIFDYIIEPVSTIPWRPSTLW
jgi:hypothetical protein